MSILVVGSIALDTVETPFGKAADALGGSATYFSVAASHFTDVKLVGVVGTDFPQEHVKLLKKHNIDTAGLEKQEGKTFRWSGVYEVDMNNRRTLSTDLNVFETFSPKIPKEYLGIQNVFLANIDPSLQYEVLMQVSKKGRPKFVALDTMNLWIQNKKNELIKVLKKVDVLLINESEAKEFAGELNLVKAAKKILALGPKGVVIKKGEYGALYYSKSTMFSASAYPLESVCDPTGAGDSFAGGFVGYIAKSGSLSDKNIRQAVTYGTVMGSFCCQGFSLSKLSKISRADIQKRFQEVKKFTNI
ncbi:MAG: sugar kinase [Elusimicrobia bacterium RIFOXYA2_FULL_39_19]|nr:MAG: sugar kinase [Elusimicrobia bacterium RIFOXYA2_FULL_39_19]